MELPFLISLPKIGTGAKPVSPFTATNSGQKAVSPVIPKSAPLTGLVGLATSIGPAIKETASQVFAGPIERAGAVVQSVKQGSLQPLKESFQKQFSQPAYQAPRFEYDTEGKPVRFVPGIAGTLTGAFAGGGSGSVKSSADDLSKVVSKLTTAIKEAKPVRAQANKMASVERGIRAGKGAGALKGTSGEGSFYSALGQLKGELPKPQFEGVRALTDATDAGNKLTQPDIDVLFNAVKEYPMDFYSQINTMTGLSKILDAGGGRIPTPGELKLLSRVFGKDLPNAAFSKRSLGSKAWDLAKDVLNVPRSLMSSIDMSAPLRQGAVLFANNPKKGGQAFKEMFKFFGNEKYFDAAMEDIQRRPSFQLMRQSGLAVTDAGPVNFALDAKEEAFMSNLAGKIPGAGILVRASERAYSGFLNKLRADVFDDISKQYIDGGINPADNPEVFERLADFVNTASGRGDLGPLNRAAPIMNGVFFSPRFMASRFQMLNPVWYARQTPQVRKLAALSAVKFVGTGLGILGLAKAAGFEVEADPRSSDFGQIRKGNFRWDVWAGFRPWVVLISRMISGETKSTTSGKMYDVDRLETPTRFLRSKLAPVPSLVTNIVQGKDLLGAPVDINGELVERMIPLYIQDLMEAVHQGGITGGASVAVPAFFGIGVNAYSPTQSKKSSGLPALPQLPQLPELPKLPSL